MHWATGGLNIIVRDNNWQAGGQIYWSYKNIEILKSEYIANPVL